MDRPSNSLCMPLAAAMVAACLAGMVAPAFGQSLEIAAVVNDQPISAWDIDQRVKFYRATGNKSPDGALHDRSLKELVDEVLMSQEAKRLGVTVEDTQVRDAIETRLKPIKSNFSQFSQYLRSRGVYISTLENRLRAQFAWHQVIQRTYGNLVQISESDIDEAVSDQKDAAEAEATWALKRVLLKLPKGADDAAVAARLTEADTLRAEIDDCASAAAAVKHVRDARLTDLPDTRAEDLVEPTRSLVQQAAEGQVTPPNPVADGVEMFVVCRKQSDGGRREVAQRQLVNQEFEMLAERHLRDARQDAVIVYR